MNHGDEVWIKAVVLDVSESAGVRLAVGEYGCEVWIAKSKCKPVEPEAVVKVEYPEGANAIFVVPGHDRNGTVGTAKLDGKFWFFESLDKQFLTWCKPSELKFLNREPETVVKQFLTSDAVNPSHYKQGPIECIEAIKAALGRGFISYLWGNIIKYLWRWPNKNGVEDLKKARWYLDRLIREEEAK
jgi:hypothetical protein